MPKKQCRFVDLCRLRRLVVDLCFLRVVRDHVRLCLLWLSGGVEAVVVGNCCENGVAGTGCTSVVLVDCGVDW